MQRAIKQEPGDGIGRQRTLKGFNVAVRPNSPFTAEEPDDGLSFDMQGEGSRQGAQESSQGGEEDLQAIWGGKQGQMYNEGAGPMMVLPKVRFKVSAKMMSS